MRILIHVGFPKTATKWFQKQLFTNIIDFKLVDIEDVIKYLIYPDALKFDPIQARNSILKKYKGNIIISFENLLGTTHFFGLNGYWVKENAVRLRNTFPEAEIIIFLRNQFDLIASSYYQYIFAGGTHSINKYLHNKYYDLYGLHYHSYSFFEFDQLIDFYQKLFTESKVKIYFYEEFKEGRQKFIEHFTKDLKIEANFSNISYRYENRKMRYLIIQLFRLCNLFTSLQMVNKYYILNIPYWMKIYRPILIRLNRYKIFGWRLNANKILGNKNIAFISEYYKISNRELLLKMKFTNLKKYNYPL